MPVASPSLAGLSSRLPALLNRLGRRLRQAADELSLPPGHFAVLLYLAEHPVATVTELALHEGVRLPSMTEVLKEMERDGLVAKQASPDDRRRQLVSVTKAGARATEAARQARSVWLEARLAHLTAAEVRSLERALPALEHLVGNPR